MDNMTIQNPVYTAEVKDSKKIELTMPKQLSMMDIKGFNEEEQQEITKFADDFIAAGGLTNNQLIQSIADKNQRDNLKYALKLIDDASNTEAEERVREIMKEFMVQAEIIDDLSTPKKRSFMQKILDNIIGFKDEALRRKAELEQRKNTTIDILREIGVKLDETTKELQEKDFQLNDFAQEKIDNIRLLEKYIMACMIIEEKGKQKLLELNTEVESTGLMQAEIDRQTYLASLDTLSTKIRDLQDSRMLIRTSLFEAYMIKQQYLLIEQQLIRTRVHSIPALINSISVLIFQTNADITREGYKDVNKLVGEIAMKTAETVAKGYVEVAKDSKEGILTFEQFKKISGELIKASNDVTKILEDAKKRREEEGKKLEVIEEEIKNNISKLSARFSEIEGLKDSGLEL